MKVYELSKELGLENKELIKVLQDLGVEVKSHMAVLSNEDIQKVKDSLVCENVFEQKPEQEQPQLKPQQKEPWKPDLNRMIRLKNLARGKLIYKSKRINGYTVEWEETGAVNYMELGEFINLKNSYKRFITEPWIRIMEDDEIEILKYANIYQYYKELIEVNDIEELLSMKFEDFQRKFDSLPDGYKNTVAEKAAQMIKNGQLDSIKIKKHIEEKMSIDLDLLSTFTKE